MFGDLDWPLNTSCRFVSISWASCFCWGYCKETSSGSYSIFNHDIDSCCYSFSFNNSPITEWRRFPIDLDHSWWRRPINLLLTSLWLDQSCWFPLNLPVLWRTMYCTLPALDQLSWSFNSNFNSEVCLKSFCHQQCRTLIGSTTVTSHATVS